MSTWVPWKRACKVKRKRWGCLCKRARGHKGLHECGLSAPHVSKNAGWRGPYEVVGTWRD